MKAVWKYEFKTMDYFTFMMPEDTSILTVQVQHGKPCMWVLVDTDKINTEQQRHFLVRGTGHPIIPEMIAYIGSYQVFEGTLVFHLFEQL